MKIKTKKIATDAVHKLRKKLTALAMNPGTPDEGIAATAKLKRLVNRYDFTQRDVAKEYLFAGRYQPAREARPILTLDDLTVCVWVKWAIEQATGIRCVFRGSELLAEAAPRTAERLAGIGRTIADGFGELWARFQTFPAVQTRDREVFFRGLYDGMMDDRKEIGEALPVHSEHGPTRKAKRLAVARVAGLSLHPYAVAVELGEQLRFNKPIADVSNQLQAMKPKQIAP